MITRRQVFKLFGGRAAGTMALGSYANGHIIEDGRHLFRVGGLGCSIIPIRFGMPPELVVFELGTESTQHAR